MFKHFISLIYTLFLNKEPLYKELETEIWLCIIRTLPWTSLGAHGTLQTPAELNGLSVIEW